MNQSSSSARCLIVGAGEMGRAHMAAVRDLPVSHVAVFGASETNRGAVEQAGVSFHHGDLSRALKAVEPTHVIVAAPVERLVDISVMVMATGVRHLLIEKPGLMTRAQGRALSEASKRAAADVRVGYNRRFYGAVRTAQRLIAESGEPVSSVQLEFTEWSHQIEALTNQSPETKARWLLANSMHVIDMAFLPVGLPDSGNSFFGYKGSLGWHSAASMFTGAGYTESGALFTCGANWDAPGRWGTEWLTSSNRYIFRPLEKLHVMRRGSVAIEEIPLDDDLDQRYKPGIFLQTKAFLGDADSRDLPRLGHAIALLELSARMAGYDID